MEYFFFLALFSTSALGLVNNRHSITVDKYHYQTVFQINKLRFRGFYELK